MPVGSTVDEALCAGPLWTHVFKWELAGEAHGLGHLPDDLAVDER